MNINVEQLADAVVQGLEEYHVYTMEQVEQAAKKAANTVKNQIAATAPQRTGAYAKSWKVTKQFQNSNSIRLVVHSKTHYRLAHLLEHGHVTRNHRTTVPAQSHIAAAERAGEQAFFDALERALRG